MSEMLRVLERGYELIWREDRATHALSGLGPDFEWIVPEHPEGGVRHGPEAVIEFFREWSEQFDELEVDWELRELAPDRALAVVTTEGRGRASGAPAEMRFAQLWTWRGGRFVRMVQYDDVDEAVRAAALGPRSLSEIARAGVETFNEVGIEGVLAMLAEDVVWEEDPEWPDGSTWRGRDAVRRALSERLESTTITPEVEQIEERGRRVLVLMRWRAVGHGSGAVADLHMGVVYDFDGELVKRARFFLDPTRAREEFEAG
jgi:ketosteroid isomerase-like protein